MHPQIPNLPQSLTSEHFFLRHVLGPKEPVDSITKNDTSRTGETSRVRIPGFRPLGAFQQDGSVPHVEHFKSSSVSSDAHHLLAPPINPVGCLSDLFM